MHRRTIFMLAAVLVGLPLIAGHAPEQQPEQQPQQTKPTGEVDTFKIDGVHSAVLFRVLHMGAGTFYGRFNKIEGSFAFKEGSDSDLSFEATIPIDSVDSNSESRDRHLKSPDFFNVREHPTMTFKSTGAKKVTDRIYEITGDLTIHGVTKSVTGRAEWTGCADMGRGYRCGFDMAFKIKRSDFGVSYGAKNGIVSDDTTIIIGLEGVRQ